MVIELLEEITSSPMCFQSQWLVMLPRCTIILEYTHNTMVPDDNIASKATRSHLQKTVLIYGIGYNMDNHWEWTLHHTQPQCHSFHMRSKQPQSDCIPGHNECGYWEKNTFLSTNQNPQKFKHFNCVPILWFGGVVSIWLN